MKRLVGWIVIIALLPTVPSAVALGQQSAAARGAKKGAIGGAIFGLLVGGDLGDAAVGAAAGAAAGAAGGAISKNQKKRRAERAELERLRQQEMDALERERAAQAEQERLARERKEMEARVAASREPGPTPQELEEWRVEIGEDNLNALTAIVDCEHERARFLAGAAGTSSDPDYRLAARWIEALAAVDSRDQAAAQRSFEELVIFDDDIDTPQQASIEADKAILEIRNLRRELGITCPR
jgi:hypothetical protein